MSHAEMIQVRADGAEKTVSFSPDHLNCVATAGQIAFHLMELMGSLKVCESENHCLKLDFTRVDRINSAGLNELIGINSHARSRGIRLELLDVQQAVRDVFELTRLERLFQFSTTPLSA